MTSTTTVCAAARSRRIVSAIHRSWSPWADQIRTKASPASDALFIFPLDHPKRRIVARGRGAFRYRP